MNNYKVRIITNQNKPIEKYFDFFVDANDWMKKEIIRLSYTNILIKQGTILFMDNIKNQE